MPDIIASTPNSLLPLADAEDLRAHALAVAENSYAPYSRFRVGAALLLAGAHTGQIVVGCNVENASFRLTCCAEQSAIAAAVTRFGPKIRLAAVAVANLNHAASVPCGACRQTLLEFAPDPSLVTVFFPAPAASGGLTSQRCTLAELLPAAFHFAQA